MFAKLKQLLTSPAESHAIPDDGLAECVTEEISQLESELESRPADNKLLQQLMVKYNQAVKIYSGNKNYRNKVDEIFIKIDELRNTIRKNI